jgi:hypothetical protein
MTDLFFILISVVEPIFDQVFALLAACPEAGFMIAAIIVTPNFPPPITPEEQAGSLTKIRRWHGTKDEKFDAVKQMIDVLNANVTRWMQPGDLRTFCLTIIPK